MDLSQVLRTAILFLICRPIEAEKNKTLFNDLMAVFRFERMISIASEEDKRWIFRKKREYDGINERNAKAGACKGKVFDNAATLQPMGVRQTPTSVMVCGSIHPH
jgi:O-methyltransferase involved in polyketide biosynthesis